MLGSEHVGVCLDTGNNVALLEDPMEVVETLAPLAFTTHIKDMAVVGELTQSLGAGGLSDGERDALARALSRTLETCELLVTYAVGIGGKPSKQ